MTPVYSPPTEKPMTQRNSKSSVPAVPPICSRVGSSAVTSIATVITVIEARSTLRRPRRSPMWPKTSAPNGRIT